MRLDTAMIHEEKIVREFLDKAYGRGRSLKCRYEYNLSKAIEQYLNDFKWYASSLDAYLEGVSTGKAPYDRNLLLFTLLSTMDFNIIFYEFQLAAARSSFKKRLVFTGTTLVIFLGLAFWGVINKYEWVTILFGLLFVVDLISVLVTGGYGVVRSLTTSGERAKVRKYFDTLRVEADLIRNGRCYVPHLQDFIRSNHEGVIPPTLHRMLDLIEAPPPAVSTDVARP